LALFLGFDLGAGTSYLELYFNRSMALEGGLTTVLQRGLSYKKQLANPSMVK
jgi:hypothetical protein